MVWVKGKSGNPAGRPRGIVDKRQTMQKALGRGANAIIAVVKAKALEGDMQAASLVLARLVPTLKPEGVLIRFELDSTLSISQQFGQITQAVANGQISVDEAATICQIIKLQVEAAAIEGGGADGDRRATLFKDFAHALGALEAGRDVGQTTDAPTEEEPIADAPSADDPPAIPPPAKAPLPWADGCPVPPWLTK